MAEKKPALEPGWYRADNSWGPVAAGKVLEVMATGEVWWLDEDGKRETKSLFTATRLANLSEQGLTKLEEGAKEDMGDQSLVGRYTISPEARDRAGYAKDTVGYLIREDGTKAWLYQGGSESQSSLADKEIREAISQGTFVKVKEKGEEMAEEQKQGTWKASADGWKVGDKVRWTAPPKDAREWGEVTKILDGASGYPKGHGVEVKWDIGLKEGMFCDDKGNIHAANQGVEAKALSEKTITGMRREQRVEKLNIRKRDKPKDVDIVREGTQIILPPGMTFDEGITWLTRKKEADEKEIAIMEIVDAIPLEGAYAFKRALDRVYGFTALVNTPGFFGSNPPVMIGVEVEAGRTEQVPWGRLSVPNVAGYFETGITMKDGQFKFVIQGKTKQKYKAAVEKLAALTRDIAKDESIYKGKAIRVKFPDPEDVKEGSVSPLDNQPKFLTLDHVVEEDLIFPEKVQNLVETAIFVPIEKRERCLAEGVPFKRGILLEGPWGTGKTLTADVTAKKATRHGITFIYLENVKDLEAGLRFANLYAPAVVFAEDIDQVGKDDRHDEESPLNTILNTIDGVDMKNSQIMVVLTTNYINEIEQGLLRPGRIDTVVPVRAPDAAAASKLVALYARGRLAPGTNLASVGKKLEGQIPAVIREVVERSKLEAIGRLSDDEELALTARDLERATDSMLTHLELLRPKAKDSRSEREKAAGVLAAALDRATDLAKQEQEDFKRTLAGAGMEVVG